MANFQWFVKLFPNNPPKSDIVRWIRTEYSNEVKHLRDEDVMSFHDNVMLGKKRREEKCL